MRWYWYPILILFTGGCAWHYEVKTPVRVHWMDINESAPFKGLLMDESSYERVRLKILKCENNK